MTNLNHCLEKQGGWDVTDWYVVEGCCMRVKLMSFDHDASLDIISEDRRCFGATKTGRPRVMTPAQDRLVFFCVSYF